MAVSHSKIKPKNGTAPPKTAIAEIARILSDAMIRLASVRTPIGAN